MFQPNTTDSIIKPLLKLVSELDTHIKNQTVAAAADDQSIDSLKAARDFKLLDVEAASKILNNIKGIVGN